MHIGIIGHFGGNDVFYDGQTVKTRNLEMALLGLEMENTVIDRVDTYYLKNNPIRFGLQCIRCLFRDQKIIVIVSEKGRRKLFPILYHAHRLLGKAIYHCAIGGRLANELENNPGIGRYLNGFQINWVESIWLARRLKDMGILNAAYFPNFKALTPLKTPSEALQSEPFRFCMFSRIMAKKGVCEAVAAVEQVNARAGKIRATLDIYGPVDPGFKDEFERLISGRENWCRYRGVVEPHQSVAVLKDYYMLLFPTGFRHEGMPGTIIDAMMAGLPVIAREWQYCREMIEDGKNGLVYDFDRPEMLASTIEYAVNHPESILPMRRQCLIKAEAYRADRAAEDMIRAMGLEAYISKGDGCQ